MVKVMSLLSVTESALGFSFEVRALIEMHENEVRERHVYVKVVSGGSIEGLNLLTI